VVVYLLFSGHNRVRIFGISHFLTLSANISKTVADTAKVTIDD